MALFLCSGIGFRTIVRVIRSACALQRAEEVTVYADAICALHKLGGDHFRESTKMMEFTEDDAKEWTARMKNADGSTGPHWTMEQTTAVAESMSIHAPVVPRWACGVTMNMMYSGCYPVADFCADHPRGVYVLALSSHVVCAENGSYFDTWDSGNEIPLFYLAKEDK